MKRSGFAPRTTPMARGSVSLKAKKPKAAKPKRAAREAHNKHLADMCRDQDCYLDIRGICEGGPTVPCHSNQYKHGKGRALKAEHQYTVPGCRACHHEIDQGHRLTREERFAIWDAAFERWTGWRGILEKLLQSRHNGH